MIVARAHRFRLFAELPVTVAFKSVTYRLEIEQEPVSQEWRLKAVDVATGSFWLWATAGSEMELEWDLKVRGLVFASDLVAHTIFQRLVSEGRGEVVPDGEDGLGFRGNLGRGEVGLN